jgi:hypothetical protein
MSKYVLYKFDQKFSDSYDLNKLKATISEDLSKQCIHVQELCRGSFKLFEKNGQLTLLTKREMSTGDLLVYCDEEDGESVEYYRIEKAEL